MIQHLLETHDHIYYLLGGVSLVLEITVLGLSGPLLFFGIACFITGVFASFGWVNSWEMEIFSLGLTTAIIAAALWKPLRAFQNAGGGNDTSSDMIGMTVTAATDIDRSGGKIRYSGIDWNARISPEHTADSIKAKDSCQIVSVQGTTMLVRPAG